MGRDVFISHSSRDKKVADEICAALEAGGIRCWMAPRDIHPGESWAQAILRGISECRMMVLVFSTDADGSIHVRREVERAMFRGLTIAPFRIQDIMPTGDLEYFLSGTHWMDAIMPPMHRHLRELCKSVRALLEAESASNEATVSPAAETRAGTRSHAAPSAQAAAPNDSESAAGGDTIVASPSDAEESVVDPGPDQPDSAGRTYLDAAFVHEHPNTGFLADVFIPESDSPEAGRVLVSFDHKLLARRPLRISVALPGVGKEAVRYIRLRGIIPDYPVVLRVYQSDRLRSHLQPSSGPATPQSSLRLRTQYVVSGVTLQEAAGIVLGENWKTMVPVGTPLPAVIKRQMRTTRDGQKLIKVCPAVLRGDQKVHDFPALRIPVLPAPAGVAWIECVFRVDPDGRYTVWAHDPVRPTKAPEVFVA
jgi:hypothetical protein